MPAKKILLIIFLFSSTVSNGVDWKELDKDSEGNTYYVDVDSILEEEGYVYYKNLINFFEETRTGTHSHVSQYKVDCLNKKQTWLSYAFFSQSMANGKIIVEEVPVWNHYGSTLNEIRSLVPGSIEYKLMGFVCRYDE
tara:strand:- start:142 stop:555 length:414 start_codon:yes stop_codon:yes gene_type:complete